MNLNSDKIQVFPTQNSRDNGKLMLEENVYNIARRVTKLNYVYDKFPILGPASVTDRNCRIVGNNDGIGIIFDDGLYCNIHGYDIQINGEFNIWFVNSASQNIKPDSIPVKSTDYDHEIPFGLVLSKIASIDRLKGDKLYSNGSYYYYGVDIKIGEDFENADDDIKLRLGFTLITDNNGVPSINYSTTNLDYNKFVIDGSTVCIFEGDNVYPLDDFISGNYVAKRGNLYNDNDEVQHQSDMYGSLTFREDKDSTDSYIEIGFTNDASNKISLIKVDYPITTNDNKPNGISIYSIHNSPFNWYYSIASFDNFKLINYPSNSIVRNNTGLFNKDELNIFEITNEKINPDIEGSPVNYYDTSLLGLSTDVIEIIPYKAPNTIQYNVTEEHSTQDIEHYYKVRFDDERVSLIYDSESIVGSYANYKTATIFFGNTEESPIFLDYDVENKNLSINDLMGSLGVVKYCDGSCVDNNEIYANENDPYHNDNGIPYTYADRYVPKEYSETIYTDLNNGYMQFYYIDTSYIKDLTITESKYNSLSDNIDTYIYVAGFSDGLINMVETRHGFYVSNTGIFTPSKGAFDTDVNGNITTPPQGHGYASIYVGIGSSENIINYYDYCCSRYKIDNKLCGKQLLISNFQEAVTAVNLSQDVISSDKELFDSSKLNVYFCKDRVAGDTGTEIHFGYDEENPQMSGSNYPVVKSYTLVPTTNVNGSIRNILTFDEFVNGNHIINVPTVSDNENLYLVISYNARSLNTLSENYSRLISGTRVRYHGLLQPTNDQLPAGYTKHGYNASILGWGITLLPNPKFIKLNKSDVDTSFVDVIDNVNTYYVDINKKLKIDSSRSWLSIFSIDKTTNEYKTTYNYNYYKGYYQTSKSYKSFRVHGFFPGYTQTKDNSSPNPDVQPSDTNNYKYMRLIYNVGFEFSDIIVKKINVTIDGYPNVKYLYKLYRKDGENIIISTMTKSFNKNLDEDNGPYPYNAKYFYINDLKLSGEDKVFFTSNVNYEDESEITLSSTDTTSSEFYKDGNVVQTSNHYVLPDGTTYNNKWWFMKDLIVTNTAGINFNVGQNKFNVNIDSYFNETVHPVKLLFGDDDEFSTMINSEQARFVYPIEVDSTNVYKPIRIDESGLTFENDPTSRKEKSTTISKIFDEESGFDGLEMTGDFKADRVFNAVYNDYADNVKCSNVVNYEPGDIICKDPYSEEYVISSYDLRYLVVGVYSDTFGHLLGGDKHKSVSENSKNYVPIAVAGNVMVKVKGLVNVGDLIEVSDIPGVGRSAKKPELGTIIGKALQAKNTTKIERILMQVMLI